MISGINQASQMSSLLFSKLDTKSQGYIEKSDLASAFSQISNSGRGQSSASVDDVFSALDSDSDGKVTKDEFSTVLSQLQEQLNSQRSQNAMSGQGGPQGANGMPPPPPPGGEGPSLTEEELTSALTAADSSDTRRTALMSKVLENFEAADTDGDGKVSFQEAMAYDQSSQAASGSESAATASASSSSEAQVMIKILQLMHAYRNDDSNQTSQASTIATVA